MGEAVLVTVAADAACLDGHFPGNPLVPGVVILDLVCAALERQQQRRIQLEGIPNVKFTHPLRPGETLRIDLAAAADERVNFSCSVGERRVADGCLRLLPGGV